MHPVNPLNTKLSISRVNTQARLRSNEIPKHDLDSFNLCKQQLVTNDQIAKNIVSPTTSNHLFA